MRIYIWTDIEGIVGMIDWDTFASESPRFQERRRRMMQMLTDEVNAAIRGALDAGAEYVLVKDSHGPGDSMFFEQFPAEAEFIIGTKGLPHPWAGLDESFDACMVIGAHPMAGTTDGNLPHTWYRINQFELGDAGLCAAVAASLDVPTVFASGDHAAMKQLETWVPDIHTVSTKQAFGPYSARMRAPVKAQALIREGVKEALDSKPRIGLMAIEKPYKVEFGGKTAEGDNLIETFMGLYDPKRERFGCHDIEPERSYHHRIMAKWYGRFDSEQET